MGKTTKGTQAASQGTIPNIPPNQSGSTGGVPAPLPPNAFRGKPERTPELVYIRERPGDGFLESARDYYTFFGLRVENVESIAQVVQHLSQQSGSFQRLLLVSHAHPRGMIIPMFTGAVRGTNAEAFRAFGRSNLDGLRLYLPFEPSIQHLFNWDSVMSSCLSVARSRNSAVLAPFGLDQSGSPSGELQDFFKYCFDIVYANNPGRVRRNPSQSSGLTAQQRNILTNFVGEILTQMSPNLVNTTIAGHVVTAADLQALRTSLTSIAYADLNLPSFNPDLGLTDDSMNDFPSLQAVVQAIRGGFRDQLNAARQRISGQTLLEIRGCRVGEDPDYLEAMREFFGRSEQLPTVTGPRWFQTYRVLAWQVHNNRAQITSWLNGTRFNHPPAELRSIINQWAELIRVRPLHTDFWQTVLQDSPLKFAVLSWRSQIPALFIPAPGLVALNGLNFSQIIARLKDYFNVPNADVPNATTLTALQNLIQVLPTYNQSLFATVNASTPATQLQQLYQGLKQINTDQSQSIVPATPPNPLTATQIQQYQQGLITFLENTPLQPIKRFMTAANTSLQTGDGLYYYLFFAGLPVYVFGRPQLNRNGLAMLNEHQNIAMQSWYKCLWADPLPATGNYTSARLNQEQVQARRCPMLVGEDRTSISSVCPLPRYNACIRKRPLPPSENEQDCDDSQIP